MSEHQPIPFDDTEGPAYLGALWNRPLERIKPRLVELEGGGHLLFAGMTHAIAAPSGSGKSWVALAAMLAAARETGRPVLCLDFEASLEVTITRLRQLGATLDDAGLFAYWRLDHAISDEHADQLGAWIDAHRPCLTVLDGVTRATALHGIDADTDNAGFTKWAGELERACRVNGTSTAPALLLIDHISEKTGVGLHARGVTAKRDTITGAAYVLRGRPITPKRQVTLQLIIAKIRHGGEQNAAAALVKVTPAGDGLLDVAFLTPGDEIVPPGEGGLATACEQVSRHLEDNGPASKRALCGAVEGDDKTVVRAIAHLEAAGHIGRDTSGAKSGGHYPYGLLKPYRSDDEAA